MGAPGPLRAQPASADSGGFSGRILAAHNRERAAVGLPPLQWDDKLAADATQWAAYISEVGSLVHSPEDDSDANPQGENLWAGTHGAYTPEEMIDLWGREREVFRPGIFPDNATTGNVADVSHYTQMVWRSTRKVGCGLVEGEEDDFLVCRYLEGGNVMGESPF